MKRNRVSIGASLTSPIFRAQSYAVQLPQDFTCTDCTIRLLREAEEWGSNYRFWSCADIDVSCSRFFFLQKRKSLIDSIKKQKNCIIINVQRIVHTVPLRHQETYVKLLLGHATIISNPYRVVTIRSFKLFPASIRKYLSIIHERNP